MSPKKSRWPNLTRPGGIVRVRLAGGQMAGSRWNLHLFGMKSIDMDAIVHPEPHGYKRCARQHAFSSNRIDFPLN